MPSKPPPPDQDVFIDMPFPLKGIDVASEYGEQPPGTTPVGTNCRAYEVLTQRGRGGQRPGIVRYINSQVSGSNKIQHLNTIVTSDGNALLANFTFPDDPDVVDDPTADPRNPGRVVRQGGTGIQPNRNVSNKITAYWFEIIASGRFELTNPGLNGNLFSAHMTFNLNGHQLLECDFALGQNVDSITDGSSGVYDCVTDRVWGTDVGLLAYLQANPGFIIGAPFAFSSFPQSYLVIPGANSFTAVLDNIVGTVTTGIWPLCTINLSIWTGRAWEFGSQPLTNTTHLFSSGLTATFPFTI